jgi:tetratricopeptide (TPR) repeat protein
MRTANLLERAVQCFYQRNFPEAQKLCLQALAETPLSFGARHLLGVICAQQGRIAEALELIEAAIQINPTSAEALISRGNVLKSVGRWVESLKSYDRALVLDPGITKALLGRAVVLQNLGRIEEGIASCTQLLAINPNDISALYSRANMQLALNHFELARSSYEAAVRLKPDFLEAINGRANALLGLGRIGEAIQNYDAVIALYPGSAEGYCNKGAALRRLRQFDAALQNYDHAITLQPSLAQAWNNKGNILLQVGRSTEALCCFDRAIELKPDYAEAYCNKGGALRDLNKLEEALKAYDQAITLAPEFSEAYFNKGLSVLLMGRFGEGWQLYERRKKYAPPFIDQANKHKLWSGQDVRGKTLVLYAEQGLGDTIQFCRYAKLAEAKGANVIIAAPANLSRLLTSLSSTIRVANLQGPVPAFDYYAPLLSAPIMFGTTLENIPADVPYLRAESEVTVLWGKRIGTNGFKVGICWQGNKMTADDGRRSIPPRYFEHFAQISGLRLISIQVGEGIEQLQDLAPGIEIESLGEEFNAGPDAFVDSAGVIANLDLVITADTAVAHLAGALGCPTWVVLRHSPDWRWLLNRADTPWYPNVSLFRQPSAGDWRSVFLEMRAKLIDLTETTSRILLC